MSKELAVGIAITANAGSALAGISSVKRGITGLGEVAGHLKSKHDQLGATIQRNLGTLAPRTIRGHA